MLVGGGPFVGMTAGKTVPTQIQWPVRLDHRSRKCLLPVVAASTRSEMEPATVLRSPSPSIFYTDSSLRPKRDQLGTTFLHQIFISRLGPHLLVFTGTILTDPKMLYCE